MPLRVLELFSGLGGWRYALEGRGTVAAAYDLSPHANATYALNHGERPLARELATLAPEALLAHGADTWAMSPPCQPFCRMGRQKGLEDPRSRAFLHLLEVMDQAPPRNLLLENVEGFEGSEAHGRLAALLARHRFHVRSWRLCPTAFGIPNQRPRFYLAASRSAFGEAAPPRLAPGPLAPFLDAEEDPALYLPEEDLARHRPGLDLVRAGTCRSACFIGGYGRRYVGSGSFLVTERGVRRFSPREAARLLGYPPAFRFPESLGLEARYKLLGNGLSLPVARWVAQQLPGA